MQIKVELKQLSFSKNVLLHITGLFQLELMTVIIEAWHTNLNLLEKEVF